MALIKNAYSPGQWYVFFYEAKNVEQSAYYNNVETQFKSWYSFLEKDQIQGKMFDFLGVPNICGKINKKQLHKIHVGEKSRQNFNKLDVQVMRSQLNKTHQPPVSTFKFFKSKNDRRTGKNADPGDSKTEIGLQKVYEGKTVEGKSKITEGRQIPQGHSQLDFSKQSNNNYADDTCINSDDCSNRSDEDIFADFKSTLKQTKKTTVFKTKVNSVRNTLVENPESGNVVKISKETGSCTSKVEETFGLKQSKLVSNAKKKVEFKNEDEYFFFKAVDSSTTQSSQSDTGTKKVVRFKAGVFDAGRSPLSFPIKEIGSRQEEDYGSNDDDNPFDAGFMSPIPYFGSATPLQIQEMASPYELATSGMPKINTGISSTRAVRFKPGGLDDDRSPILSANQELCSGSHRGDDGSIDDDNAFDTGFLSPLPDFCSASPLQSQDTASPHELATTGTSPSIQSTKIDDVFDGSSDFERAYEFKTVGMNGRGNESNEIPHANERDTAAPHGAVLTRSQPQQELSVDRIRFRSLSGTSSTDDEILSQASASTEIFATTISVDLRVPGALQSIKNEYKRLFDYLGLQNSFSNRLGGPSFGMRFENAKTKATDDPNIEDVSGINFKCSNTIFQFPSRPTLPLTTNSIQNNAVVDSQEELLGISKLCVNSIEFNPVVQCAIVENSKSIEVNPVIDQRTEERLDGEKSKGTEVISRPLETSSAYETLGLQALNSDKQHDSMIMNINVSKNIDDSVDPLLEPVLKNVDCNMMHEKKRKRLPNNEGTEKIPDNNEKLPDAMIEKRATPMGKNRLPLKKRSVSDIFSSVAAHTLPEVNERFLCVQSLSLNDADERKRPGSIDKNRPKIAASTAATHNYAVERPKDIPSEAFGPSVDGLYEVNPDTMKMRKQFVDLAWKLSMPHISESFFNDPDVSTKFRKGEISLSASHATSSRSTLPRKHFPEESRPQPYLSSRVEHEFGDLDLNSPKQGAGKSAANVLRAATPNISVMATNDYTESPSPRLEIHSVSEKNSNSPFVGDFPEHTKDFLESENTSVSVVYNRETQDKAVFESNKFETGSVCSLLNNNRKSLEEILGDANSDDPSIDMNIDTRHDESSHFSIAPSPVLSRWNYENRTPMRKNPLENNSSGSDSSLHVLPSTSQRLRKNRQRSVLIDKKVQRDLPIPSTNSDLGGSNDGSVHSNENRPGFDILAGTALREDGDEIGETGRSKPEEVSPKKAVRGKRMSFVISNVIMKPVGAEQQSNDHNFLICEDDDFSLHLGKFSS